MRLMQNWLTLATTAIAWRRRHGFIDGCWVRHNGAGSIGSMGFCSNDPGANDATR
jgi:hypothetical protein